MGHTSSRSPTLGVSSVFQTYGKVAVCPSPNEEYFLMTFFGFLVVGPYFLGKIAKRITT
jgi:hypothetical protein